MKFYALAYQHQEDVYYNFEEKEDTLELDNKCFLPTKQMAEDFIEDQLSIDYVPVEIELLTLNGNGTWSMSRGRVDRWDAEYDNIEE